MGLTAFISEFDEDYSFLIAGDFNTPNDSKKRNVKNFKRFVTNCELENLTTHIPVTFSQNQKTGDPCASKLDHILSKNFPTGSFVSSDINKKIGKGGHIPLELTIFAPHIEIEDEV